MLFGSGDICWCGSDVFCVFGSGVVLLSSFVLPSICTGDCGIGGTYSGVGYSDVGVHKLVVCIVCSFHIDYIVFGIEYIVCGRSVCGAVV